MSTNNQNNTTAQQQVLDLVLSIEAETRLQDNGGDKTGTRVSMSYLKQLLSIAVELFGADSFAVREIRAAIQRMKNLLNTSEPDTRNDDDDASGRGHRPKGP